MIVSGIATGFTVYFTSQVVSAFGINSYIPGLVCSDGTGNYCGFNQHIGLSA